MNQKFERLTRHIQKHPVGWVETGIGLEALREAVRCAPPAVIEDCERLIQHDSFMQEVLGKHAQDAPWITTPLGKVMLVESLNLTPAYTPRPGESQAGLVRDNFCRRR